jgi:hypothetical protein
MIFANIYKIMTTNTLPSRYPYGVSNYVNDDSKFSTVVVEIPVLNEMHNRVVVTGTIIDDVPPDVPVENVSTWRCPKCPRIECWHNITPTMRKRWKSAGLFLILSLPTAAIIYVANTTGFDGL